MSTGWFGSLGWWEQQKAYDAFDLYREEPTEFHLEDAIRFALPVIRVVYSTQKFKVSYAGDEDDLISHAAFTISKAIPKMSEKPREKLDNDKKYMRYLFTCVVNAFYREYDVLHGKANKLQKKIDEHRPKLHGNYGEKTHQALEAELTLQRLPAQLLSYAMDCVRFGGKQRRVCAYMLTQMIMGREIAKSVLHLMGCNNRPFFEQYCDTVLLRAFFLLRQRKPQVDSDAAFDAFEAVEDFDNFQAEYEMV